MCATSKELLAVVVQDSHRVKAGLLQLNSTTPFIDTDAYVVSFDVSLTGYIWIDQFPKGFKPVNIESYDGTTDPAVWIEDFLFHIHMFA